MSLGLGDSVDGGGGLDMFDSGGEVAGVEAAEDKHENYDAGGDAAGGRKRARSAVDGDVSGGSAKFRKGQHEKACRLCCLRLTKEHFSGTKAECKSCHPDFEAARRDAIKQQELDFSIRSASRTKTSESSWQIGRRTLRLQEALATSEVATSSSGSRSAFALAGVFVESSGRS